MIQLIGLTMGRYLVHCQEHQVYSIGPEEEARFVLDWCGVPSEEVELAFYYFKKKGDNYADFGVNKTLIFTKRTGVQAVA